MKKESLLFLFLFLLLLPIGVFPVKGQPFALSAPCNNPRSGDQLFKCEVPYREGEKEGENLVWDFRELSEDAPLQRISYLSLGEEESRYLAGCSPQALYYYLLQGDSLLYRIAYETPESRMDFSRGEPLMRYPMVYGKAYSDTTLSTGRWCGLSHSLEKALYRVKVDSWGAMLLPGGDTLPQVIRLAACKEIPQIHPLKKDSLGEWREDSLPLMDGEDTLHLRTLQWRWYARGYRYPILEMEKRSFSCQGKDSVYMRCAYFFPPSGHTYLEDDTLNLALLQQIDEQKEDSLKRESEGKTIPLTLEPGERFACRAYPNPVSRELTLEYYLAEPLSLSFFLYNARGMLLWEEAAQKQTEGLHRWRLDFTAYPPGSYTLLIQAGEERYSRILIKP